jgi:eukaryotic-like serine/threonine-protein kinase
MAILVLYYTTTGSERASCAASITKNGATPGARSEYEGQHIVNQNLGTSGTEVTLENQSWHVGPQLPGADVGGFGEVCEATGRGDDTPMVAKFIPRAPGADRELLVGGTLTVGVGDGIVPIVDSGAFGDSWVIIMPRADKSLSALMADQGPLDVDTVISILSQVASALSDIGGAIVHRDLKPANVLLLDGRWRIADFGLARYVDAATQTHTHKWSGTPEYLAPEQWRGEHATPAADVYAFGVIAYEMVAGQLPFTGPDFRRQHLGDLAPEAPHGPTRLRLLIEQCLYKAPGARPTAQQVVAQLSRLDRAHTRLSPGAVKLQEANLTYVREMARQHAAESAAQSIEEERAQLYEAAEHSFRHVDAVLSQAIEEYAPTVELRSSQKLSAGAGNVMLFEAELNHGSCGLSRCSPADWDGPFDVIAKAAVIVRRHADQRVIYTRSHSLWFCDAMRRSEFAWYEMAFTGSPFSESHREHSPIFALNPDEAVETFHRDFGGPQLAWPVIELDLADLDAFTDRWIGWFAEAAAGKLNRPSQIPEMEIPTNWRRDR